MSPLSWTSKLLSRSMSHFGHGYFNSTPRSSYHTSTDHKLTLQMKSKPFYQNALIKDKDYIVLFVDPYIYTPGEINTSHCAVAAEYNGIFAQESHYPSSGPTPDQALATRVMKLVFANESLSQVKHPIDTNSKYKASSSFVLPTALDPDPYTSGSKSYRYGQVLTPSVDPKKVVNSIRSKDKGNSEYLDQIIEDCRRIYSQTQNLNIPDDKRFAETVLNDRQHPLHEAFLNVRTSFLYSEKPLSSPYLWYPIIGGNDPLSHTNCSSENGNTIEVNLNDTAKALSERLGITKDGRLLPNYKYNPSELNVAMMVISKEMTGNYGMIDYQTGQPISDHEVEDYVSKLVSTNSISNSAAASNVLSRK